MTEQDLEVIKSRTLVLKCNERSSDIVLVDPTGGDMYFTFELKYVTEECNGTTQLTATDPYHADVVIDTRPNAITKPNGFIHLGTYGYGRPLYLGFVVQPQIGQSGEHNVIVTFYTGKEVNDGGHRQ